MRIFSILALMAFTAWILPLGAFIKPAQEKTACDGKRAFHMCSMMTKSKATPSSNTVSIQNASNIDKNVKSSAGSSDEFLIKTPRVLFAGSVARFRDVFLLMPSNPSLYRLDAVPKP